ncbi:Intron-binding protein aquarius [Zalerion maritima]|uniref:Pre-mRNA-splicing factor n=1 Tax=Zalerion maritima TaxID=339359 RepID=A0AAD5RY05_9PEZI|nr:Intron-binding protein aquarius [Zalerion maritima]
MPNPKRLKGNAASQPAPEKKGGSTHIEEPVPFDDNKFAKVARENWLQAKNKATVAVKDEVLRTELWDPLVKDAFSTKSLAALESLQALESYLWPGFSDEASDWHVLLIVALLNIKRRERLETWEIFEQRPLDFSAFFKRVLALSLDRLLPMPIRIQVLYFIIYAFQSLDCTIVRKECVPLVAISIWHNLSTQSKREAKLSQEPHLKKAWRAAHKRYDSGDDGTKARLLFERTWFTNLSLEFLDLVYAERRPSSHVHYCERFIELLADLQSQLPTRRYINTLVQDLHIIPALKLSPMFSDEDNSLLRELHVLLSHYTHFTIDDQTGVQLSKTEAYDRHCASLARLQRASLKHFKSKLTVLALGNYGSIDRRHELQPLLETLTDVELEKLASVLNLRTSYPELASLHLGRPLIMEAVLSAFERRRTFQDIARDMSIVPTEQSLFENSLLRADEYDGSHPLALPKLNLQYLSVGDFLWRAMFLYRCESFYGIRSDIEKVLSRLRPESKKPGETTFGGSSKMALPISRPAIMEVVPALVGDDKPSVVKAEISVDLRRLSPSVRREWESLRPDDVIFLLAIDASKAKQANGSRGDSVAEKNGLLAVRTAEVVHVGDDQGKFTRDRPARAERHNRSPVRRIQIRLDPKTYKDDQENVEHGKPDVYEKINVVVRRASRENNFKRVLESIRSLALSDVPLAPWLHEVFLGYGDPAGATYKQLRNRIKKVDFRDTFLDWQHLVESLPGKIIEPSEDASGSFPPPYVLASADKAVESIPGKSSKKRRRDAEPALIAEVETLRVSTYKPPNNGPYPTDAPKLNTVRFTPAQIEAITSGSQPGLTVIVGPPGTGKTDVATQIINNIYHNFPEQRTLLVAHSNQALNQLFAKIIALDIDERHLLRLGHGEEDLDAEGSFSKYGRVEAFLENRDRYLAEVTRLAASIGAPGAHGNSAETAGYFNSVYIEPAWAKFTAISQASDSASETMSAAFPFHAYFSDAPQPLFPSGINRAEALEISAGCYRHISKIFSELADAQPFEILRRERDKANYLLTNEARIIAMTSTHAAMRRGEIASLGFNYDNVVMEEAAQITEIENFIPLAMQKPGKGKGLQRVVLCGDHLQNSPIVQSLAFRHYANLEQSLFSRLVRLGVPAITLDQQGRARPSIASLYQWRYPGLTNLPHVTTAPEYLTANAGFKYEFQFINVPDYKGQGEREPTPHFLQNLGEAEYAVAIYQYMRLLGYPAKKISLLTTYAGQRALVRDVLNHRCQNPVFGMPKHVTTVDKYQGEQNDYIILSLTRTTRVGYLRDIRRITVALSRARLGLYVLGRRSIFATCHELQQAFAPLVARPEKLVLVSGENWPSSRPAMPTHAGQESQHQDKPSDDPNMAESVIEGVEHLGQYVYKLTTERVKIIAERQMLPAPTDEAPLVISHAPAEDEAVEDGNAVVSAEAQDAGEGGDADAGSSGEAEEEKPSLGFVKEGD